MVLNNCVFCIALCSTLLYNVGMGTTTTTQKPAAGGTSNVKVSELQAGMVMVHNGEHLAVASVEDVSAPAWMRAACDPGSYLVVSKCGYRLTVPKINTVAVVISSIAERHLHVKREPGTPGFHARYFASIHKASRFQRMLPGSQHKSSKLEWFSIAYDNPSALMRLYCKQKGIQGLYRVVWLEPEQA